MGHCLQDLLADEHSILLLSSQDPISYEAQSGQMATINRHLPTNDVLTLPVINISDASQETGRRMIDAAATHGFLYIDTRGTAFTPEVVGRQFELVIARPGI